MGIWTSTASDWIRILYGLLPHGLMWGRNPDSRFDRLIGGLSNELVRVHGRAGDLMDEADPQTTDELLADWERIAGLPEFGHTPATEADRRIALVGKLASRGGQSCGYFERVAAAYGAVGTDCYDGPHALEWVVEMAAGDCVRACCTSSCTAALVEFLSDAGITAAAAIDHYRPAHTRIFWDGGIAS